MHRASRYGGSVMRYGTSNPKTIYRERLPATATQHMALRAKGHNGRMAQSLQKQKAREDAWEAHIAAGGGKHSSSACLKCANMNRLFRGCGWV